MKKTKKIIILFAIVIVGLSFLTFTLYNLLRDKNALSINEKTWIDNNKNSVYSIQVPNDINVFGKNGSGVYYNFIDDLGNDLNLKLNSIVYSIANNNESLGFNVSSSFDSRDLLIYTDYYVLLSKEVKSINNLNELSNSSIGILSKDLNYITTFYTLNGTINSYDNKDELFKKFDSNDVNYVIVPLTEYKDIIIKNLYNISYFFNDAKIYFSLHLGNDETLNSILTKYYNKWMNDNFNESYNNNDYKLFIDSLGISDIEEDKLTDSNYQFEYLVNQPYTLLSKGSFSGIVNEYLEHFTDFSNIEFNYVKVRNFNNLKSDINKKKINVYFNQYNYDSSYNFININMPLEYYVISNRKVNINIDSLKAYNKEIYVQEDSLLYGYLENFSNITIKTYKKNSNIKKLIKKNNLVIVDKYSYDNYLRDRLSNIKIDLEGTANNTNYSFAVLNNDETFYKLFSTYINTLNPKTIKTKGLNEYFDNYKVGNYTVKIAKYIIILIIVILLGIYIFIKSKRRIVLNTKIKNNEKIRYVDMLTSLKNRNYLNDRLEIWNQNTVYPQAVIVLDLNNVKYLNDTFGHEEGDKQIKAVANILFKTQLENTELLRTDGNEFMVYLVGYSEKQVISYIKKLIKEFKKLPYEYGVAVGFSMIKDDLKLIEDAFNEATIQMRKNKASYEEENDK